MQTGTLHADGKKFDSSLDRNSPFDFTLGAGQGLSISYPSHVSSPFPSSSLLHSYLAFSLADLSFLLSLRRLISCPFLLFPFHACPPVIKGWDQGLLDMCEGEKRKLTIPADMGYGARGAGATIPPHATLVFEVGLPSRRPYGFRAALSLRCLSLSLTTHFLFLVALGARSSSSRSRTVTPSSRSTFPLRHSLLSISCALYLMRFSSSLSRRKTRVVSRSWTAAFERG